VTDPLPAAVQRLKEAGVDNPRLDARLLYEHARAVTASALVAQDRTDWLFASFISRRAAREPLAYITGRKEFWSLAFAVGPGALIPRPETELLIEQLLKDRPDRAMPLSILDLGTGSGCLLIAALSEYLNARGVGIDRSPQALAWAQQNIEAHRLQDRATLIETDWPEEAEPGFDAVLANPPYIPAADIAGLAPEVARYEPRSALDGGPDGLDAYRALALRIGRLLKPDGRAYIEIGVGQSDVVEAIFAAHGLAICRIEADLAGIPRCIVAKTALAAGEKTVGSSRANR
jgi:release factor glutamine methyltransferase